MNLGTPIAEGNTAKIYLYDNRVIKVFHDYFPEGEATYEATKQELVRTNGLPVPKVMDVTTVNGCQAIVMEYVKGKTLGELMEENEDKTKDYLSMSVDIQRKLHNTYVPSLEQMQVRLKRQILSGNKLTQPQKELLITKLKQMEYENKLCHGDFHVYNIILSDDRIMVIDWVDSSLGDFRADVCRTYLLYSQYSIELAELYLYLYSEKSNLPKEDILIWLPIVAGARLSENLPKGYEERLLELVEEDINLQY